MLQFYKLMVDINNNGSTILSEFRHLKQAIFMDRLLHYCQDKDSLIWYKNSHSIEAICKDMDISTHYLTKLLKELKELGFLHNPNRGTYIISKRYFQIKENK
jgi:hypothetical protein